LREAKGLNGEVEEVLGSRGRIRLLKALIEAQRSGYAASTSKLKASTRLRRRNVQRHLEILLNHGWIEDLQTAEGRKYRLKENGKTEAVKRLFRELGYI
jgi:DNA-binding transcriptional ArsR family regulator